jgi:hypothetical protein
MSLTNTAEDMLVKWMFTDATAPTRPTAWYAALHTGDPGDAVTDPSGTEVTTGIDADYVRKSVTFADPVTDSGQVLSEAATTWTVDTASGGYTVTHLSIWTASTSGTCLISGALPVPRALTANQVLTFSIGDIIAALN